MMDDWKKEFWMETTGGIREEYVEEAALPRQKRRVWPRLVSAAAALALIVGMTLSVRPQESYQAEYTPFFAIRAYAQDGTVSTLDSAGDAAPIGIGQSDLFPGKKTYVLDISLTDTLGNRLDLGDSSFHCLHRGNKLPLGQADENLSIQWVDEDGFYGYRLTGWCEEWDYVDITIRDENGMILHQKTVRIEFDEQYRVDVYTSYTYEEGLTTEELIAKLFDTEQNYGIHTAVASTPYVEYRVLVDNCGGFAELEQREDAASLLLQRWLREMEAREDKSTSLEHSGRLGLILSQDAHWNNLTEEEIALVEHHVMTKQEYQNTYTPFPGKQCFSYDVLLEDGYSIRNLLTIEYAGRTEQDEAEHFSILFILPTAEAEPALYGWRITGWVEEPTELTLTVTSEDGTVIRQDILLVTPTEDGYQIDILRKTP